MDVCNVVFCDRDERRIFRSLCPVPRVGDVIACNNYGRVLCTVESVCWDFSDEGGLRSAWVYLSMSRQDDRKQG